MPTGHTLSLGTRPALRGALANDPPILIKDITLREGEQAGEVAFTIQEKVRLAHKLAEAGVDTIQVGFGANANDRAVVRQLKQENIRCKVELLCTGFVPTAERDLDEAIATGTDSVSILYRASDRQLTQGLNITREIMLEQSVKLVEQARRSTVQNIAFTPSYSTQADVEFLKTVCRAVVAAGANSVSLPDSLGIVGPWQYAWLIHEISQTVDVIVSAHCHNDYGLALANTLAGLEAGAQMAEVTVNGLGERAGNTSLDELFLALKCLYGLELRLDGSKLTALAREVSALIHQPIPPMKPVTGENAFAQKLEIHAMVATRYPDMFEAFPAALVGQKHWLRLGKGTGPKAVEAKLKELGEQASEEQVQALAHNINRFAEQYHRSMRDEEFLAQLHQLRESPIQRT